MSKQIIIVFYLVFHVDSSSTCCNQSVNVSNGVVSLFRNGVTSSSYYYGIVQIYINSTWGNICDDLSYEQYEADVICHQLGYTGASNYSRAELIRYYFWYCVNI